MGITALPVAQSAPCPQKLMSACCLVVSGVPNSTSSPQSVRDSLRSFCNWYTAHMTVRGTKDRAALARKDTSNLEGW